MRKLLCVLVIALLFLSLFPYRGEWTFSGVRASSGNTKATMMLQNLYPVGYDTDGQELAGDRNFPWEPSGSSYWGSYFPDRESETYLMPNANAARSLAGLPYPVKNKDNPLLYTEPAYWAYVYISTEASGGRSTSYHRWHAVVDSAGQLWMDPDGVFHDPRYDSTADPSHSYYETSRCVVNPLARMDPSRSNNTQGPYFITPGGGYREKIYFWDKDVDYKRGTNRAFRIGHFEMNYYYDENSEVALGDEEFYLDHTNPMNPVVVASPTLRFSSSFLYHDANFNGQYDAGEAIYRKGSGVLPLVQDGDYRYTHVSVIHENRVYNYRPSGVTAVHDMDMDHELPLTPFFYPAPAGEIRFIDRNNNGVYDIGEPVYLDKPYFHAPDGPNFPVGAVSHVTPGDIRLSTIQRSALAHEPTTALGLLEVLRAHCDNTRYDITVLSDVWMGSVPSTTVARLRAPNGEFQEKAQRIQKSTVLGPQGSDFVVPGTTFHDISLGYRGYLGIQIFNDNGFDNNRGTPLPFDHVFPQSLTDEYKPQRTGEAFLGATNSALGLNYLDFGQSLSNFAPYVMYYDTRYEDMVASGQYPGSYAPHFGCGEPLYQKKDKDSSHPFVAAGDLRLTEVAVDRGGTMITYPAGTLVTPGDTDVGWPLHPMQTSFDENGQPYLDEFSNPVTLGWKYADGFVFNLLLTSIEGEKYIRNEEYDIGEMIYFDISNNGRVDIGDVRMSSGEFSGAPVECGSMLDFAQETWRHEYPARMLTLGLNGDPRYIDIEVLPGALPMEVSIDPPLQVEQTSTVKIGLKRSFKKDEKVYVSVRGPSPGERQDIERPFLLASEAMLMDWEEPSFANGYETPFGINYAWGGDTTKTSTQLGGDNLRSQRDQNSWGLGTPLWGGGPDGFKIGNTTFSQMTITEDGMVVLLPHNEQRYYVGYEYRYDYLIQYGQWYDPPGGRPYPYSYSGRPGTASYYNRAGTPATYCTNFPYFNIRNVNAFYIPGATYNWPPGSLGYVQSEALFRENSAWIMPLGGQWHVPGGFGIWYPGNMTYVGYYANALEDPDAPNFPYGVRMKRTEDFIRVVWKVVTYPFQGGRQPWNFPGNAIQNPFDSPSGNATPFTQSWTSEFDMVLYRDGTILFNYKKVRIPSQHLRIIDNDNEPFDLDPFNAVDTDTLCAPGGWTGRPYIPYIGIVNGVEDLRAFSPRSYRYTDNPNARSFDSPEGMTIGWILPPPPDDDLYQERVFEDYAVLDANNPYFEFQYTPYRGSVHDGFHGDDATLAGTSLFSQFEIRAYSERGGIRTPVPLDSDYTGSNNSNYIDPFWKNAMINRAEWQQNYRKEPFFIIPVEPVNTMPNTLRDYYDSFAHLRYDIAPEKIDIFPDRECLDLVSTRQPAFSYRVENADNPNDVNDPHGTNLVFPKWFAGNGTQPEPDGSYDWGILLDGSGTYGRPTIMNYNAHGAGIDYLFTARLSGGGDFRRYIVQVNSNGTAEAWRWFEADLPGQVFGALDQHDMLYSVRGQRIDQSGQLDPLNGNADPPGLWFKVPDSFNAGTGFTDVDCSTGILDLLQNLTVNNHGFPALGNVNAGDRFGMFRNNPTVEDPAGLMPLYERLANTYLSAIETYGVPVVIMSPEDDFPGGIGLGVANPKNADSPLTIRLYATNVMFDYNSTIAHPPSYVWDRGPGINYLGYKQIRVVPADPVLNFSEFTVVDRALQLSKENYTAGSNPWYQLPPPNPQIRADYDPILRDWSGFRSYPGGQTHTGRALPIDPSIPHQGSGRNAYPALQANQFHKLGTEFFPLSDYGIYFTIRDLGRNHYTFDPLLVIPEALLLRRIIVRGPFMYPKIYSEPDAKIDTSYRYQGLENVPITYDTSGEIVIDATNYPLWMMNGTGFNRTISLDKSVPYEIPMSLRNKTARYTHALYYGTRGGNPGGLFYEGDTIRPGGSQNQPSGWLTSPGILGYNFYSPAATYQEPYPQQPNTVAQAFNDRGVHVVTLDEIIPTGYGTIEIIVETADGIIKHYQDCCQEDAPMGITVEGLNIEGAPKEFMVDQDNHMELTLKERDHKGDREYHVPVSNNALMIAWQDRGVINPMTGELIGAGDGWVSKPPRSSDFTNVGTMYLSSDDLNGDGKISFNDWETEILGSYDLATNTWTSGYIDARTFQRNNGRYRMEFTAQNKNMIDTVGIDFGGLNLRQKDTYTPPDGVIGDDEVLPIIINAYKYGDDNNDRAFTPLYNLPGRFPEFSHEVYLTGRIEIPVRSQQTLVVTTIPDMLTAGVQPELQDPSEPLTLVVTDEAGVPLDLLKMAQDRMSGFTYSADINELGRAIWNGLIKDPHPDPLPQYYWLRTDLHNDDGTSIGNTYLFSNDAGRFEPIEFDISQSHDGKYVFRGFTANDAGSFDVFVYTPDRRRMGKVSVKVELPQVEYTIVNVEDPQNRSFDSPGNPDFVMTAGDNNIYRVQVRVRDAQGRPLTGIGKSVSICGGSNQEVSRFTPFVTAHQNYYRVTKPNYWHYYGTGAGTWRRAFYDTGTVRPYFLAPINWGDRWNAHIAVDTNNNGSIDLQNDEISRTQPFRSVIRYYNPTLNQYREMFPIVCMNAYNYLTWETALTPGLAYYNTENVKYDNGTFAVNPMYDINSHLNPEHGWGFGAIYNRPYYSDGNYGMIFANLDRQVQMVQYYDTRNFVIFTTYLQTLSSTDSINLDTEGTTEFYIFGEDVFEVGGLVGKNSWSISPWADVAGAPFHFFPTSPNRITSRYGKQLVLPASLRGRVAYQRAGDFAYQLDWDAMPSDVARVKAPRIEVINAETLLPLGSSFMDEHAYDLVYGKDNHVTINVYPADSRDIPVKSDMQLVLSGNSAEFRITGRLEQQGRQPGDASSTTMFITPTGTGLSSIALDTVTKNNLRDMMSLPTRGVIDVPLPNYYFMLDLVRFDVAKGIKVQVQAITGPVKLNQQNNLRILVSEIGSNKPIAGSAVTLSGAGLNETKTSNEEGVCFFDNLVPRSEEPIRITATKQGYLEGRDSIDIGMDSGRAQEWIHLNTSPSRTNQPLYEVSGTVESNVQRITINKAKIALQQDRTFKATVTLKEGQNSILIEMEDAEGKLSRKILVVELKTQGPSVILDSTLTAEKWIEVERVEVSGNIDPGSFLWVNQKEVVPAGNRFSTLVDVSKGNNQIKIVAKDDLGNETQFSKDIYVFAVRKVEFIIGSSTARIDGQEVAMEHAPFVESGRSFVPLRIVSESFGAKVTWNQDNQSISLVKGDTSIFMTIGSHKAIVNDRTVDLDAPPVLRNGRTFVPVRFVSEWLGGKVEWNERIRMIIIEFLV